MRISTRDCWGIMVGAADMNRFVGSVFGDVSSCKAMHGRRLLLVVLLLLCSRPLFAATNSRPPNVIIILADDLGYGDLSCYGHPKFKTPNLDRMAAEGTRLDQFNTPAPFCAPTRAALMTGRYPVRCGMTANPTPDGNAQVNELGLPTSEITLADLFHRAGYATGMVGKWHLGHVKKSFYPTQRGFDSYLG